MDDEFAAKFADPVERITGLFSERVKEEMPMTAAIRDDWPPCFESAVSELNQGVNVNHVGRVFLAAFSRSIGLQQEQTCNFFLTPRTMTPKLHHTKLVRFTKESIRLMDALSQNER